MLVCSFAGCQGKQDGNVIKIGVMQFGEFDALQNAYKGFKDGLAEAGYVDGEKIKINYLSAAADPTNCPTIADTLINDGSNLILAIATPSVSCIKEKTTSIPVLFTAVSDPVSSGILSDAEKPGSNISGTSDMNPVDKQIDLIKQLFPEAKTVAVLYCSSESNSEIQYKLAKVEIEKLGMTCVQKTVSAIDEAKSAIESLKGQADAIYIPTDNTLADGMKTVSAAANDVGIPVIVGESGMVGSGGLATFGIDYYSLGKRTAEMAVKIIEAEDSLKAVSETPVFFVTEDSDCKYAFNTETASKLGITIPEELLSKADIFPAK